MLKKGSEICISMWVEKIGCKSKQFLTDFQICVPHGVNHLQSDSPSLSCGYFNSIIVIKKSYMFL